MFAARRPLARFLIAAVIAMIGGVSAVRAQVNVTWANIGPDWGTGANWIGGNVPTANDSAFFIPNLIGGAINPSLGGPFQLQNLAMFNGPLLTNYAIIAAPGTLLELSAGTTGGTLSTRGIGVTQIDGPTISGSSSLQPMLTNVGTSTFLYFSGDGRIGANQGNISLNGGSLLLDNTGVNIPNRILSTGTMTLTGGGSIILLGNAAGTTTNAPLLNAGTNNVGGVNEIRVSAFGGPATLVFANTGAFSSRPGTRGIYHYMDPNGTLGDPSGARITFNGTPFLAANGLLANTAGGGTVGFAIATDVGGTDFATWNATNGVIRAGATQTGATAAQLQTFNANARVQYDQATATQTATGTITNGSLRITPTAPGHTLAMGTNPLVTNALMLDGINNFTISSNNGVNFGATGTRYVYVNRPDTVLTANGLVMANGGNPTVFAGPGFVDFTGTASQNTLTMTTRFIIGGGTVRGNNTQIGFTGGSGVISFAGGVLEIKNGNNGTGAAADFTRALGAAAGNVTWGATTTNEQGGGGFSAFGSAASVNIGGAASPANLQWGQANFIADGFALIFGSTKSNAALNFLNPLQLDNGTNYQMREIRVPLGVGGDSTSMVGPITGNLNADLIKTGDGTLVMPTGVTHTYSGVTFVAGGTLQVNGVLGAANAVVNVGDGVNGNSGTLSGTGVINRSVNIISGGTLNPGNSPGILTISGSVTMGAGSTQAFQYTGTPMMAAPDSGGSLTPGPAGNNKLEVGMTMSVDGLAIFAITGDFADFNPADNYSFLVGSAGTVVPFDITDPSQFDTSLFNGFTPGVFNLQWHNNGNNVYFNMTPVPEPFAIMGVTFGSLAVAGWIRRRRRR